MGKNILDAPEAVHCPHGDVFLDSDDGAEWLLMLQAWIDESGHEQKVDYVTEFMN
jgi:hypothetical protein